MVGFIFDTAVVEETSNETALQMELAGWMHSAVEMRTHRSRILINNQHKSIKFSNCVYARCANIVLPVPRIPYLHIPTSSLGTCYSKVDICRPPRM